MVGNVQVPELEAAETDSQSDTYSTTSSLSVRLGEDDSKTPKRLASPELHEHAEAALHLTSYVLHIQQICG
jgi:hypothetical protein